MYSLVTFDVYGTLIDWEPTILAFYRSWADIGNLAIGDEKLLCAFDRARARLQAVRPPLDYTDVLRGAYGEFCSTHAIESDQTQALLFARCMALPPAFDDAKAALVELRAHCALGALSNIDDDSVRYALAKLGNPFEFVVTATKAGAYKPDANHFVCARDWARARGIERSRWLHVGQSLRADIAPANALGIDCAWIRRPGRSLGARADDAPNAQPTFVFSSLGELVHAIRNGTMKNEEARR